MLDCFTDNSLAQANRADCNARESVIRFLDEHLQTEFERFVVPVLVHERPAKERPSRGARAIELDRLTKLTLRCRPVASGQRAPAALDMRRCAEVIVARRGALILRRQRLECVDQLADLFLERGQLGDLRFGALEERDDARLQRETFGGGDTRANCC